MTDEYRVENRTRNVTLEGVDEDTYTKQLQQARRDIEPWLSALFQSEHLNLLVGNGLTAALCSKLNVAPASMDASEYGTNYDTKIKDFASFEAQKMARGRANIEDELRVFSNLVTGLRILGSEDAEDVALKYDEALIRFARHVADTEKSIKNKVESEPERNNEFNYLLGNLLMSFASRSASRDRLHLFTLNYDRVLEVGFDVTGIRKIDRFVGALEPRFQPLRNNVDIHYLPEGLRTEARAMEGVVRYTKLHGSIDWVQEGREVRRIPRKFGTLEGVEENQRGSDVMIFPNSAKDIETAFYPYAELMRDLSNALCRPNSTLVTFGYSFGDDHVNRVIKNMLSLPSTHLVVINRSDTGGRIKRFMENVGKWNQVSYIIGKNLTELTNLIEYLLPKPALDTISIRRNELLERRLEERTSGGSDDLSD